MFIDQFHSWQKCSKGWGRGGGRSSEPRHSSEAFFEEESAEHFRVIFNHFELLTSIELEGLKRHLVYTKTLTSNGHNS